MAHLKVVLLTKRHRLETCTASNHNHIYKGDAVMTETILTKICVKCQETKPLSAFHRDKNSKDCRVNVCKGCRVDVSKNYYQKNTDKISEYHRKRHKDTYDERKPYFQEYQKTHSKEIVDRVAKWQKSNPKKVKGYRDKYCENNIEKLKIFYQKKNHVRRALIRNVTIEDFNPSEVFERDNYICQLCGIKTLPNLKSQYHSKRPELDHIIPLSKGGEHSKRNTQCLCRKCNMEKSNTGVGDQLRMFG